MHYSDFSQGTEAIFSIIIGINEYKADSEGEFVSLRGAINDAEAFRRFLTDSRQLGGLQVPCSHIRILANEKATRSAILSALESHFLNNPDIPDHGNAAMIFFFAGHGSRIYSPGNILAPDSEVECICPVDERTMDSDGKYVHAIPDYVLGQFLQRLAEKKGANITCIIDSCHSGGMGRDDERARSARTGSCSIPRELDSHLWNNDIYTTHPYSVWAPSACSHVLLAACDQNGIAYETSSEPFHGRFTASLITALRNAALQNITYAELINTLPPFPTQTPHCGGINKHRVVFTTNYIDTGRRTLTLTEQFSANPKCGSPNLQSFSISIGSVEGVRPGTEFSVYTSDNAIVATLVARTVKINQTLLTSEDDEPVLIPKGSRAVVTDWKNDTMILYAYIPPDFPQTSDLFPLAHATNLHNYVQAGSPDTAQISLRRHGEEIALEWLKGLISMHARETLFAPVKDFLPLHLPSVLDGIAHFHYFLECGNGSALPGFSLEMHRLKGSYPTCEPDRDWGNNGNLIACNQVQLRPEKGAKYGFTMCNTSNHDLFPHLFYFNPLNYTIKCWHIPQSAHDRPPLHRSGGVTVGMGGEGAFSFTLPPGTTSSSGFIKMFVSTEYMDLTWIEQKISPFDPRFLGTGRLTGKMFREQDESDWNALCVVLKMTRGQGF
ncbi:caspase domain-containing protein [Mycena epipterygia]|nr:caspase domain-containing protein [Mycena epipterygia]